MKRFLMIMFFLMFGLTVYSQVDNKKITFEENSKRDLKVLKTIVAVKQGQEQSILDFFYRKYKQYTVYTLTIQSKKQILIDYENELKGLIDVSEVSKLNKNKVVLMNLISDK